MYPCVTMLEQGDTHTHTQMCTLTHTVTVERALQKRWNMLTHRDLLSEKWDTLQPPDPQPLTSPFQTAFLLLSEADKFIPLVSKQSPLFFCRLHQ